MKRETIMPAVLKTITVTYEAKPALMARRCIACQKLFDSDMGRGATLEMEFPGTTGQPLVPVETTKHFDVCRIACVGLALDKLERGEVPGWPSGARPRAVRYFPGAVKYAYDLGAEWLNQPDGEPPKEGQIVTHFRVRE